MIDNNHYRADIPAFPKDFIFGAATSAYQIEGGSSDDGRGRSIWDTYFSSRPNLDSGAVAIGHYSRMSEDVALMKELRLQSYRFSVSWPRVLPYGKGRVNSAGLDFYDRLVDELLAAGIIPNLTLYHWDLPQALEDLGGWCERDTAKYFADYAEVVAARLGDRVPIWSTLNEPEVIVAGYIGKDHAPGRNDKRLRMKAAHTLMLAHGYAMQALRALVPACKAGIVLNLVPIDPLNANAENAARLHWLREYAFYLEALFKGRYPGFITEEAQRNRAGIEAGDMELIASRIDFLGVNWYLRMVVDEKGRLVDLPGVPRTLMGWEIRAEALERMLLSLKDEYVLPPIYITENGAALRDTWSGARINDEGRISYIYDHLRALSSAISKGVDVRGYYVWSLFDNLEWSLGFSKTFGLVHVDQKTLQRTPKESARWYAQLISSSGAPQQSRS